MVLFRTTPIHLAIIITWCNRKPLLHCVHVYRISTMQSFKSYFSFSQTELSEVAKTKVVLWGKKGLSGNLQTVASMFMKCNRKTPTWY